MDKSEFYDFMLSVITDMERLAAKLSGVFVEAVIAVEHDFHVYAYASCGV